MAEQDEMERRVCVACGAVMFGDVGTIEDFGHKELCYFLVWHNLSPADKTKYAQGKLEFQYRDYRGEGEIPRRNE